jgi:hypothetical protein
LTSLSGISCIHPNKGIENFLSQTKCLTHLDISLSSSNVWGRREGKKMERGGKRERREGKREREGRRRAHVLNSW